MLYNNTILSEILHLVKHCQAVFVEIAISQSVAQIIHLARVIVGDFPKSANNYVVIYEIKEVAIF